MTYRITDAHLEAKVETINKMLGFKGDEPYSTPGMVVLAGAYGGKGVHRYCNTAGGVSDLMGGYYTKREVSHFLNGMIQALRAVEDK